VFEQHKHIYHQNTIVANLYTIIMEHITNQPAPITASFQSQTINFMLPSPTIASLLQTLSERFGLWSLENVVLKYQDEEADLITLDTDQELVHAADIMQHKLLLVVTQESDNKKRKQGRYEKKW